MPKIIRTKKQLLAAHATLSRQYELKRNQLRDLQDKSHNLSEQYCTSIDKLNAELIQEKNKLTSQYAYSKYPRWDELCKLITELETLGEEMQGYVKEFCCDLTEKDFPDMNDEQIIEELKTRLRNVKVDGFLYLFHHKGK